MNIRTDLALETREAHVQAGLPDDGVAVKEETVNGLKCSTIDILTPEAAEAAKRSIGKYITIEFGRVWSKDYASFKDVVELISEKLKELVRDCIPVEKITTILVVGLGNTAVGPDALGPLAMDSVIVTHHLRATQDDVCTKLGLSDVAVMKPGVLGRTGIESADLIMSAVEQIKPSLVIAVDALASRRLARLATTVQLSNTGIAPGSGVGNTRKTINNETLGCPVIAIGIPTVVDIATLAMDVMEKAGFSTSNMSLEDITKALSSSDTDFYVSPKDTDLIVAEVAKITGYAINRAFHGDIAYEEMGRF